MKRLGVVLLLGASGLSFGISPEAHGKVGVCSIYQDAYQNEIKTKIRAGIPFELMSALFEDGALISKKVVHVNFNLWDEVLTLKSDDHLLGKISLADAPGLLCKFLELPEALKSGRHYTYRLFLNPMWGERMARLQISTGHNLDNKRLVGINWKKLAEEMPSDKILLEKEVKEVKE
ncbi:MAG: hypothetical protein AABZ06_06535 [Bdellovibrionota bacterium]